MAVTLWVGISAPGTLACVAAAPTEHLGDNQLEFEEFLAGVYQEPDTGVYIVDGDTPIESLEDLEAFYRRHVHPGALAVHHSGGVDSAWDDDQKRQLTYCVSTSFGSHYTRLVRALDDAAGAWEGAAYVDFIHLPQHDSDCTTSNEHVVFDVTPVDTPIYLARAFFPHFRREHRSLRIDSDAFGDHAPLTLTGILRHELGHTLGFRHEHTRPEAGICFEDGRWRALTPYDADSVMHYPLCNGDNHGDLRLTVRDVRGSARLYSGFLGGPRWERDARWCHHRGAELHAGDFNGDGRHDMLCHGVDGHKSIDFANARGQLVGTNWERVTHWCSHDGAQRHVGDFDGDGHTDLLCHGVHGRKWIDLADARGRLQGTDWQRDTDWCSHATARLYVGDFNGDRRSDLLCHDINGHKWIDFADAGGRLQGTDWHRDDGWCSHTGAHLYAGDFDGDSRSDLLCHDDQGHLWIDFSDARGRLEGTDWRRTGGWCNTAGAQIHIGDVNGDGLDDLVCHDATGQVSIDHANMRGRFLGTNWHRDARWCAEPGQAFHVGDLNGNGKDDLLCHDTATGYLWAAYNDL